MAKRIGICPNIDGCSKAQNDEKQEIDELDDFICAECKHELEEVGQGKKKKKKKSPLRRIIVCAVAAIAIIAGLIFALSGGDDDVTPEEPKEPVPTDTVKEDVKGGRVDTLVIITQETKDSITEPEVQKETEKKDTVAKPKERPKTVTDPKPTSHTLGYGKWTGGWKNGQPHGTGTMTYSTSHLIDSRDPKGRVAQPREYIVGEWDNGHLVQGRWFKNDGSKEAVIIGKAG